ncbi:hypothetical protein WH47_00927 [Habropoda laboriosa]|uniref:Uncharacterized protein n=1 Tax=Habropoda laboriosa TaxID=597456 RepID=A0A0L7RJW9_9HYME|nr:hypothetical protein WH47_00927 [Habropoda laboriosa]
MSEDRGIEACEISKQGIEKKKRDFLAHKLEQSLRIVPRCSNRDHWDQRDYLVRV